MDIIQNMGKMLQYGLALQGVSVVTCIICMALPRWYSNSGAYAGLFKGCTRIFSKWVCGNLPIVPDWMGAARAMIIIGFLAQCGCIALCLLYLFKMKDKHHFVRWGAYLSVAAAGFIAICVIIAGAKLSWVNDLFGRYGGEVNLAASFYLAIVAVLLSAASGGFLYKYNQENENEHQESGNENVPPV